jgi:hypothetical protein
MQTMETSILKEIEWRVMPQSSITGLLFMTGLLQGLPQKCLDTLCVTILSSYKHQLINEDCQPLRNTNDTKKAMCV